MAISTLQASSVVDLPRKKTEDDSFGIDKYQDALVQFIENAQTPITVALQGEWGSGKTSLMNLLDLKLCDSGKFHRVWINSWQYSLLRTPEEAIMKIVEGIIEQILRTYTSQDGKAKVVSKMKTIFRKASIAGGRFLAKQIVDKVGGNTDFVDELFDGEGSEGAEISQMKDEIGKLIREVLEKDKSKAGFIFFIDDLDRIDPPVAVQILELLKNIFDLDYCIFILAIDYDVVIKGLEPKFGKLSDKNEREFRSFFDKIIQLPFSMPVSAYSIDSFLINALSRIGFLTPEESTDSDLKTRLSELARLSVGQNPRALKRLTNTLSLISIINKLNPSGGTGKERSFEKVIGFALVCLQIAYPLVYNKLLDDPDFTEWNEQTAIKLRLNRLTPEETERLNNTEEFNEDWEKVLFQICQKETYSSNRAFQISSLINIIHDLIPANNDTGTVVAGIIEKSAITNLQAFDKPKTIGSERAIIQNNLKEIIALKIPSALLPPLINEIKILSKSDDGRFTIRTGTEKAQLKSWWMHEIHILVTSKPQKTLFAIDFLIQRWPVSVQDFISKNQEHFKKCLEEITGSTRHRFSNPYEITEKIITEGKAAYQIKSVIEFTDINSAETINKLIDYIADWAAKTVELSAKIGLRP